MSPTRDFKRENYNSYDSGESIVYREEMGMMAQKVSKELPEGQTGQIKIDLSIRGYEIDEGRVDGKRKIRKLKYPGLSKIISVLEKTGAKILRVSAKSKYTIIDYTT